MSLIKIDRKNLLIFAVTVIALIFVTLWYTNRNDFVEQNTNRILNRGLIGDAESLDPHEFSSKQAADVLRDIGEGLVTYSADGKIVSGVASSWRVSSDGRIYTFKFRPDARWSNGERVLPRDFVRTYRRLADPKNGARNTNFLSYIENADEVLLGNTSPDILSVKDLSDDVLEISLRQSVPFFLQVLAHPSLFPVYSGSNNSVGSTPYYKISNGPYILDDWQVGSQITLRKNEQYWDAENVFFDEVSYHIVSELAEYDRFRAGEIDITGTVASGVFLTAKKNFGSNLKISPYLGTYYYGFNLSAPKFSKNTDLRAALSLAIDREVLVENILARGELPAYSWVPPGVSNYSPQRNRKLALPRLEREAEAKRYYSKAGFDKNNPVSFELRYNVSDVQQRIALAMASMWREVLGADVTLVSEEFRVLLSNIREKSQVDVFRMSWTGDYNDAQSFLEVFESSSASNMVSFKDANFDELLDSVKSESNVTKRREYLESAEAILMDSYPIIPLYFYVSKHLVNEQIVGWSNNVMDIHLSKYLASSQ